MSTRPPRNHLFDLEIDEVSSVDRPASQLGLIAFAKSAPQEDGMSVQTDTLFELPEDVHHGDTVVTEDGSEFVYLEVDDAGEPLPLEGVDTAELLQGASEVYDVNGEDYEPPEEPEVGKRATGGARMVASRSAGTTVLEALSKAVTSEDRDQVVAKMADDLGRTQRENDELRKAFEAERDVRVTEAFIAKADEYDLPVDPEVFGPILKAIAEVLDDDELEVLDLVLSSRGVPLDEIGVAGGASNSGVLDEVSALAGELVGKAAGAVTTEQAVTALFENNPDAYDMYLREQDGR